MFSFVIVPHAFRESDIPFCCEDLFASTGEYDYWCSVGACTVAKRLKFTAFANLSDYAFRLVCGVCECGDFWFMFLSKKFLPSF